MWRRITLFILPDIRECDEALWNSYCYCLIFDYVLWHYGLLLCEPDKVKFGSKNAESKMSGIQNTEYRIKQTLFVRSETSFEKGFILFFCFYNSRLRTLWACAIVFKLFFVPTILGSTVPSGKLCGRTLLFLSCFVSTGPGSAISSWKLCRLVQLYLSCCPYRPMYYSPKPKALRTRAIVFCAMASAFSAPFLSTVSSLSL